MEAWVNDLKVIGYNFPDIKELSLREPLAIIPSEKATTMTVPTWTRQYDIVVVVIFNTDHTGTLTTANALHKAYSPLFKEVLFTGIVRPSGLSDHIRWVKCASGGSFQYSCMAEAMQDAPLQSTGGYLFLSEDVLFSHCQLPFFNMSRIWYHKSSTHISSKANVNLRAGTGESTGVQLPSLSLPFSKHANRFGEAVAGLLGHLEEKHNSEERSDGLYIPQHLATDFLVGAVILREADIDHKTAIPALIGLLSREPIEVYKATYVSDHHGHLFDSLLPNGQLRDSTFLIHPYNMSWSGAADSFRKWWYDSNAGENCPQAFRSTDVFTEGVQYVGLDM